MSVEVVEEDLLKSIDEVEARIKRFRAKVRAVLETAQPSKAAGGEGKEEPQSKS